ncbi:efflux transporter outer membrane subunit [Ideonella azotifigens]|uniref:Efflux transporter outer membrane subunit n=2 Tax=Ideonella azotifigens TaxID=513160 RepID=A0ABN1KMH4_9BURK|nr:efflux transporter outer membrane subunit [Ideonella azotifigens]MCD2343425.1 efflux transporter outer membrane subunit [Ideonella azotifigens]
MRRHRFAFSALPLVASLLLAGCINLTPELQRPALPVPATLPGGADPSAPLALPAWHDLVRDDRLRQVVERALAANRDLRVAMLQVERSRAQLRITDADFLPTVSGALQYERAPNSSGVQATTVTGGLAVSSYELDLFGRIRSNSDAANATLLATEAGGRAARLSLVTQVISAWLTLAADEEQLTLARQTLASREDTLKLTSLRAQVGAASDLDLRAAQSLAAQAKATLAQYQRLRNQDETALNLAVGAALPANLLPGPAPLSTAATVANTATLATGEWLADVPGAASSELLLARPDLIQAEQALRSANANIGAARAAYFPKILLSGSFGGVSDSLSNLFDSATKAWTFTAQAALTLFDAGRNQANVKVAEVNRDIAVAQYEKAVQTAFKEAADALNGQSEWHRQVEAQQLFLDAERERTRLTRMKLDAGAASLLELQDAERTRAAAEQALVQYRLSELLNRVALYKALGGEERASEQTASAAK